MHIIKVIQAIPTARSIGVDDRAKWHTLTDVRGGIAFLGYYNGKRGTFALPHDGHDLALAGLFLYSAAVNALRDLILWFDVPSKIGAVHLADARQLRLALFRLDHFAKLVEKDKRSLVLARKIAAQLERTMSFCAIGEDRNCQEKPS